MIEGNERLIIVFGMSHSGTTLLSHVVQQHPDVLCYTDGPAAHTLENTWLPDERSDLIQQMLCELPKKRILLKKPWSEIKNGQWMINEMTNAKFIYCYKSFEKMLISWKKGNSPLIEQFKDDLKALYEFYYYQAYEFHKLVPHFYWHSYEDFLVYPTTMIDSLAAWIGLSPWKFNTSVVNKSVDIKALLNNN